MSDSEESDSNEGQANGGEDVKGECEVNEEFDESIPHDQSLRICLYGKSLFTESASALSFCACFRSRKVEHRQTN